LLRGILSVVLNEPGEDLRYKIWHLDY